MIVFSLFNFSQSFGKMGSEMTHGFQHFKQLSVSSEVMYTEPSKRATWIGSAKIITQRPAKSKISSGSSAIAIPILEILRIAVPDTKMMYLRREFSFWAIVVTDGSKSIQMWKPNLYIKARVNSNSAKYPLENNFMPFMW